MAFAIRNLSVLAYANGFTLWHYKSQDELAVIGEADYFADASDMLGSGDMMMVTARDGSRIICAARAGDRIVTGPLA